GEHSLATADHGRRETWDTDALTGRPSEIIHLPGNSLLPFIAALCIGVVCISLLAKGYWIALIATVASIGVLLRWSWENGAHPAAAPDARTQPGDPPLHSRTCDGPGRWGMGVTLLANGSLYLSMLFGWFYLWTVAPGGMTGEARLQHWPLLLGIGLLSAAVLWLRRCLKRLRAGDDAQLARNLAAITGLGLAQSALLLW